MAIVQLIACNSACVRKAHVVCWQWNVSHKAHMRWEETEDGRQIAICLVDPCKVADIENAQTFLDGFEAGRCYAGDVRPVHPSRGRGPRLLPPISDLRVTVGEETSVARELCAGGRP